jgi:hypothetical protein
MFGCYESMSHGWPRTYAQCVIVLCSVSSSSLILVLGMRTCIGIVVFKYFNQAYCSGAHAFKSTQVSLAQSWTPDTRTHPYWVRLVVNNRRGAPSLWFSKRMALRVCIEERGQCWAGKYLGAPGSSFHTAKCATGCVWVYKCVCLQLCACICARKLAQ